jgi:hypothetical protein
MAMWRGRIQWVAAALLALGVGCVEDRPAWLDQPAQMAGPLVVDGRFGYLNRTFGELVFLTPAYSGDRLTVRFDRLEVGAAPLGAAVSPDGELVFTISATEQTLSIVDVNALEERRFELPSDYDALVISPDSRYVVAHFANAAQGGSGDAVFRNQNEITIFDLEAGGARFAQVDARVLSLRSSPLGFDFAPAFSLNGETRRLLVVRATSALTLIDLLATHPDDVQRRVFFVSADSTRQLVPQRIIFTQDDPADDRDMRMFVLTTNAQDIFEVSLRPPTGDSERALSLSLNQFPAGPSPVEMIDFIDPSGAQKLVVLNGSNRKLVVVDVASGNTTDVDLAWTVSRAVPYTLANEDTGQPEHWAVLYAPNQLSAVLFVHLDQLESRGSRALTPLVLSRVVADVRIVDRPDAETAVVLHGGGNALSVLNLRRHFDIPLPGSATLRNTAFSADGRLLFTTVAERNVLAVIELDNGHPYQVELPDPGGALVVLGEPQVILVDHGDGEGRATLLDGLDPSRPARTVEGFLLETLLDEAATPRKED